MQVPTDATAMKRSHTILRMHSHVIHEGLLKLSSHDQATSALPSSGVILMLVLYMSFLRGTTLQTLGTLAYKNHILLNTVTVKITASRQGEPVPRLPLMT